MIIETELKLTINPQDSKRILTSQLIKKYALEKMHRNHLISVYFDTPDLRLLQHGYIMRVRKKDKLFIQTIKSANQAADGLHKRAEWEWGVASMQLNFTVIDAAALTELKNDVQLQKNIHEIFTTEFQRHSCILQIADATKIEFALDIGEVRANNKSEKICEIELELIEGNEACLWEFANELAKIIDIKEENISKAERGFRLLKQ